MPLSACSSSQAPCGLDLCTPNPLPHTPVRYPSSHDTLFGPNCVRRFQENTQSVRGVRVEEQNLWGGSNKKAKAGRTFPVPLLILFRLNPSTRSVRLPAPPEPFAYSPGSGGHSPLSTFRSPPSPIHLVPWMPCCPLRPLTVRPTQSLVFRTYNCRQPSLSAAPSRPPRRFVHRIPRLMPSY